MATDIATVADIIAEKRRRAEEIERDCAEKTKRGEMVSDCYARELVADIRREADRLEAAHKRDIEELKKQSGDAAKLREALKHIKDRLPHMLQYMRVHWEDASAGGYFDELMLVIDAALAAPPRNCDVGTAEEQSARMRAFCVKNGLCRDGAYRCENCGLLHEFRCELTWAQWPYIEKEGGAE